MGKWKTSDLYTLGLNYKTKDMAFFTEKFGKSKKAIHAMARKLNINKTPNWTKEEVEILKTHGAKEASRILDRTYNSCKIKAGRI